MAGTSEWDVGCDEGVSGILAEIQEFGNRPKKTAKVADDCARKRMIADSRPSRVNLCGRYPIVMDASPAVFKTVCGALLRRPGWVRFPSIPANLARVTANLTATGLWGANIPSRSSRALSQLSVTMPGAFGPCLHLWLPALPR